MKSGRPLRGRIKRACSGTCVVLALATGPAQASVSNSSSSIDMRAGEGMIGSPTSGSFWPTYWVDAKWALKSDSRSTGLDVQFGAIQTEDASRAAACDVAPWIAGRRYCARASDPGPRFTALYAGLQSELTSRLRSGEPGDFRVYVGGGFAHLQGASLQSTLQPYAAAETELHSRSSWSARAALLICPSAPGGLGIAVPSIKVEYRF